MSDEKQKLEISQEELTLIEAALHTQAKILGDRCQGAFDVVQAGQCL